MQEERLVRTCVPSALLNPSKRGHIRGHSRVRPERESAHRHEREVPCYHQFAPCTSPSSRGPGRGPFKAKTRVRIPLGTILLESATSNDSRASVFVSSVPRLCPRFGGFSTRLLRRFLGWSRDSLLNRNLHRGHGSLSFCITNMPVPFEHSQRMSESASLT